MQNGRRHIQHPRQTSRLQVLLWLWLRAWLWPWLWLWLRPWLWLWPWLRPCDHGQPVRSPPLATVTWRG